MTLRQGTARKGFTLLEMLVATGIMALLTVGMAQLLGITMDMWSASENRSLKNEDARIALDLLSRDLQRALPASALVNPKVENPKLPPVLANAVVIRQEAGSRNEQLFAILDAENTGEGDVCAVGYYCEWDSAGRFFKLRRLFWNSDELRENLAAAGFPASGRGVFGASGDDPIPAQLRRLFDPATAPAPPQADEIVAEAIWDFTVDLYTSSSGQPQRINNDSTVFPRSASAPLEESLPQIVEVRFRAMAKPETAKLGTMAASSWFDFESADYRSKVHPREHRFSTRIYLQPSR